jgi:hypothetical protein
MPEEPKKDPSNLSLPIDADPAPKIISEATLQVPR